MADHNMSNYPQNQGGMQTNPYSGGPYYGGGPQYPSHGQNPYGYGGAQGQQPFGPGAGGPGVPPSAFQQQQQMAQPQQSYIENILRMNAGQVATVYMSFENDAPWANKVFKGVIEAAGKDHLILRDLETTERYLLLLVYLNYVTFPNQINYYYPYAPGFTSVAE